MGRTSGGTSRGAFLWTQFLGTFNDVVLASVVSMAAVWPPSTLTATRLSWAGVVFILPSLLFSGYAGQLADTGSRRRVLVWTKASEVLLAVLAALALIAGTLEALLAVLFFMGTRSAFFGPAKYSIVPELFSDRALSRANGVLQMSTFAAITSGTAVSGLLYGRQRGTLLAGAVLIAIALAGFVLSLRIEHVECREAAEPMSRNPLAGLRYGFSRMRSDRTLALAILGIAFFWSIGALLQPLIVLIGRQTMGLDDMRSAVMGGLLIMGLGAGSLLAGRLSGQKVELGLAPIGAFGITASTLGLALAVPSYTTFCATLLILGVCGGLFIVPLHALVQQRPAAAERGQVIATGRLLSATGILLACVSPWTLGNVLHLQAERILLMTAVVTLVASVYVLALVPEYFIRFVLWTLTHSLYRIRIVGQEHVPVRGPALLVCNHLSQVDGFLVGAAVQRFVRFMVYRPYYENPLVKPLLRRMHAIPVAGGNREEVTASIDQARDELARGHVVCIFAEGAISRTGNLLPFKRGLERIAAGTDVPIIPVNLDRVWGSIFSYKGGRFLWKWPTRLPYPVTVTFGPPLPATTTAAEARQAVMALGSDALEHRFGADDVLHERFLRTAKRRWRALAMADATGSELTFGGASSAAMLLARWLRQTCSPGPMVGVVLPASTDGALVNIAALFAGKVPVNLDYTSGLVAVSEAMAQCGITTVITSRAFLSGAKLQPLPGMVYLEDGRAMATAGEKATTAILARLLPSPLLRRLFRIHRSRPGDLATVIFSSGSNGKPKGVMLSHRNVLAVMEGMEQVFSVTPQDRMLSVLPFFHASGLTVSLWFPLIGGFSALYVPTPMDARTVGALASRHRATLLIGTPRMYAEYIRECRIEDFAGLRYAVAGAGKLSASIGRAFREKFGAEVLQGYGCAEMAAVVSVNMPAPRGGQVGSKSGTVGHPLPGVTVQVVDRETGDPLAANHEGLLLVRGPNRMIGYLHDQEGTEAVLRDGWYVTGDIGSVDEEGFLRLSDYPP